MSNATHLTPLGSRWTIKHTLQHTATHCNTLQHTAIHYNSLQRAATRYNALQHATTHAQDILICLLMPHSWYILTACCSVLQCPAVDCNVLQCVAACCSVLQRVAVKYSRYTCSTGRTAFYFQPMCCVCVLQRVAVFYSVLQRVTVCCSVFEACCGFTGYSLLHCIAVHCSALQCIAVC